MQPRANEPLHIRGGFVIFGERAQVLATGADQSALRVQDIEISKLSESVPFGDGFERLLGAREHGVAECGQLLVRAGQSLIRPGQRRRHP